MTMRNKPISRNWFIGARIGGTIRARQNAHSILADDTMSSATHELALQIIRLCTKLEIQLREEF